MIHDKVRPIELVAALQTSHEIDIMSGTLVGDFPGLKATGRPFSVRAAAAIRFQDGRISRWADYWSVLSFKQQVGLE